MRRATLLARLLVTPPRLQPAAPPFTRAGGRKRLRVRAFARSHACYFARARARGSTKSVRSLLLHPHSGRSLQRPFNVSDHLRRSTCVVMGAIVWLLLT